MSSAQYRERLVRAAVRTVLGLGWGSLAAHSVAAQEASEAQIEEVVVSGFRASLNAALDVKRGAADTVDAIVAEDIADFPDLNIAESLQRIPGVSIMRDAGEGRQITVRGLGPEFTRILLNGMEAMSANGGADQAGGTNRARSFDFNTFASDLFNEITVRKTASAAVEEGSLGATVDMRTAQPFDYKGFTLVGSLTGSYNDLSKDVDPRAALLISNTFADQRLGALLSVAYTKRNLVDEGSSTVRWGRPSGGFGSLAPGYAGSATLAQLNLAFAPRIPRYDAFAHEQERLGITGSLQFRPTDATSFDLDLLYASFDAERSEIYLEVPNFSSVANGIAVREAVLDSNGTITYGVFNNVDIRAENRFDELSTVFTQATLNGSHQFTDNLTLHGTAGYSESDHDNPVQTTLLFDWNNLPTFSYDYRADPMRPVLSYGTSNLTGTTNGTPQTGATSTVSSNGWYLSQIRLRPQTAFNSFTNFAADLEWKLNESLRLSGGLQLKKFEFETTERRRSNGSTTNLEGVIPANLAAIPLANYSSVYTYNGSIGIPSGANDATLLPDYAQSVSTLGIYDSAVFPLGIETALNNNRSVSEQDKGGFVQLDLRTELGGRSLRGNLGMRYVRTEQSSTGYTFVGGTPLLITAERSYNDKLPSLNLAYDLFDNVIVRLGVAKVMSRPALLSLTPGGTVNVSGANRVVTLGNPNTDPTRATTYDLGLEWYFTKEALLSVAVFRKDISSRLQNIALTNQVFTGNPFGIPDNVATAACGNIAGCAPGLPIWTFNSTINGPGGKLQGFEFSYQQPFTFLPGWLRNFGGIFNYTGVESDIAYVNPVTGGQDITSLTGLSETAYNVTLYYETGRFGARVSAAYRGDYLDQVPGRDLNNLEGTDSTLSFDASLKLNINDRWNVSLEGLNLTDEYLSQWVDDASRRALFYHHTGRTVLLGVRGKF